MTTNRDDQLELAVKYAASNQADPTGLVAKVLLEMLPAVQSQAIQLEQLVEEIKAIRRIMEGKPALGGVA